MCDCNLSFSSTSSLDAGSYKLIELPPELVTLVESSITDQTTPSLKIKGLHGEDAVLCTADKTYGMRSVVLSNSMLVVTPPMDSNSGMVIDANLDTVVIRDSVNEIIELVPAVPKLHKLTTLLRGREYDESNVDEDVVSASQRGMRAGETTGDRAKRKWLTYDDALSEIQASDGELDRGLKEKRILVVNGYLRPITSSFLVTILELLLNLLVSLSFQPSRAPIHELASTLADEHEIPLAVTHQVMGWFGEVDLREDRWVVDTKSVVREIGLGVLRRYGREGVDEGVLLKKWKEAVGDTFEDVVSMDLLSGNYLSSPSPLSTDPDNTHILTYFPASDLPVDPPSRFSELFLTRPRWRAEDISPFLADIAVSSKERDKLLLKYARATTDAEGVWFTARAQFA